jgi:transcriptional regulator with XRE-family HTH domain
MNLALKVAIIESELPQHELARRIGVSETVLSRIVQGRRAATETERRKLSVTLQRSIQELFGSDNESGRDTHSIAQRARGGE